MCEKMVELGVLSNEKLQACKTGAQFQPNFPPCWDTDQCNKLNTDFKKAIEMGACDSFEACAAFEKGSKPPCSTVEKCVKLAKELTELGMHPAKHDQGMCEKNGGIGVLSNETLQACKETGQFQPNFPPCWDTDECNELATNLKRKIEMGSCPTFEACAASQRMMERGACDSVEACSAAIQMGYKPPCSTAEECVNLAKELIELGMRPMDDATNSAM